MRKPWCLRLSDRWGDTECRSRKMLSYIRILIEKEFSMIFQFEHVGPDQQ